MQSDMLQRHGLATSRGVAALVPAAHPQRRLQSRLPAPCNAHRSMRIAGQVAVARSTDVLQQGARRAQRQRPSCSGTSRRQRISCRYRGPDSTPGDASHQQLGSDANAQQHSNGGDGSPAEASSASADSSGQDGSSTWHSSAEEERQQDGHDSSGRVLDNDMADWLQAVERAALDPHRTVVFSVPSVLPDHDPSDMLHCPTLRHMLTPRPTPLLAKQSNWDGRFVSDDDRSLLNALKFSSPASAGAGATCTFDMPTRPTSQPTSVCPPAAQSANAASAASTSTSAAVSTLQAARPLSSAAHAAAASRPGVATDEAPAAPNQTGDASKVELIPAAAPAAATVPADATAPADAATAAAAPAAAATAAATAPADASTAAAAALEVQVPDATVMMQCAPSGEERVCVRLPPFAIRAGARETVYFDPAEVKAAIVVTGNICPGINNVIEAMVKRLADYGVNEVMGIRYGMRGFVDDSCAPVTLTKANTEGIHLTGGSILGAGAVINQGPQARERFTLISRRLREWGVNMLYVIGGEGGNRRAAQLAEWCRHESLACSVVGVPKSIENDMLLIDSCFGHQTAVQEAQRPLMSAKTEASSALRGVGIVKVKGRRSGHLAVTASLASGVVDAVLIPEVRVELEGPGGLLEHIEHLLESQGHAVICVAEGAGQEHIPDGESAGAHPPLDAAGNPILKDIGSFLKKKVKSSIENVDVKYIDSAYLIESTNAAGDDGIYCRVLAYHAVDAAFAGYTGVIVGQAQTHYVLLPMQVVTQSLRRVDTKGMPWARLRGSGVWVGSSES